MKWSKAKAACDKARADERGKADARNKKNLNKLNDQWQDKFNLMKAEYDSREQSTALQLKLINEKESKISKDKQAAKMTMVYCRRLVSDLLIIARDSKEEKEGDIQKYVTIEAELQNFEQKLLEGGK